MEITNTKPQNESPRNVSIFVIDLLILTGLVAEFFGLKFYISQKGLIEEPFLEITVSICIIFMLIHQFFIIKNFHRIDHMTKEELVNNGFGNWVIKSRVENLIRVAIFVLFACLTGEIVYLLIAYDKNTDLMTDTYYYIEPVTRILEPKKYDLTWITNFYISAAFYMSLVMLSWDILGRFYDKILKPLRDTEKKALTNKFDKVVAFPFKDPFWMFLISDSIAFLMWLFLKGLIVNHDGNSKYWLLTLFGLYSIVIIVRLWGAAIASWTKLKAFAQFWNKITFKKLLDEL